MPEHTPSSPLAVEVLGLGMFNMPATNDWVQRVLRFDLSAEKAAAAITDAECRDMILACKSSWKQVKATYLQDKPVMARLVAFRKSTVNGIISALDQQWQGRLVAKAVGSDNLTSDYDITFTTKMSAR